MLNKINTFKYIEKINIRWKNGNRDSVFNKPSKSYVSEDEKCLMK